MKQLNTPLSSAAATDTSLIIHSGFMFQASVQATTSAASAAGDIFIQGCNDQLSPSHFVNIPSATIAVSGAAKFLIPVTAIPYEWIKVKWVSSATGIQTVTTVADSSGSLNNKYFYYNDATADGGTAYYVWVNVSGGGTDPMIAGKTGIAVAIATNDTANTVAAAVAAAITGADANVTAGGAGAVVTITNNSAGSFIPAVDVNTGFAFAITAGAGTIVINTKGSGF